MTTLKDRLTKTQQGLMEFQRNLNLVAAGEMISSLMQEQNLTKTDLARKAGISVRALTSVLQCSDQVKFHLISDIMTALGRRFVLSTEPLIDPPEEDTVKAEEGESEIEVETKIAVSAEDFEEIVKNHRTVSREIQTNDYFDDHLWTLARRGSTLRIRWQEGKSSLTLKTTLEHQGGTRTSSERTIEIDAAMSADIVSSGKSIFEYPLPYDFRHALSELVINAEHKGRVLNTRTVLECEFGTFEADRLTLPSGVVWYEIEIDKRAPHKDLVDYIYKIAQSAHPTKLSKFDRFKQDVIS